jgi:drug/metabolite transporter (DMT)-like permease
MIYNQDMKKSVKGTLALLILTVLYGFYGVYSRLIGKEFGPFSQQWIRNGLGVVIVGLILILSKKKFKKIKKSDRKWIALWLLTGSWIMIAIFVAFNHLLLSTVYFLFYSTMIISGVVCGRLFYKEKLNSVKLISILFSLLGLAFIYSLSVSPEDYFYVILSLMAGVFLGLWNTISKKFSSNYSELQLVFWDALAGMTIGLLGFLFFNEALPISNALSSWFWMVAYALTQVLTVGLLVYGFKHLEAQVGSVILPVEIAWASIFAYLVFKETLTVNSLIGGSLILIGALLPNISKLIKYEK